MSNCKLSRIIWGLVLIFILNLVVLEFKRADIEADLQLRAQLALQKAGLVWAKVSLSGRDAFLHGAEGIDPVEREEAVQVVSSVFGIRTTKDVSRQLPHISPYIWSASRKRQRLKLTKYVPSDKDRKTIIGIANAMLPGLNIDDRMKLALGAKDKSVWLGAISFALQQLRYIDKGQAILTDGGLKIHGRALDSDNYVAFAKSMKENKPDDVKITSFKVVPPRAKTYSWSIGMIAGKLALEGYVPDLETRETLVNLLNEVPLDVPIVDNLVYASGQPKGWRESVKIIIRQFFNLEKGIVTLSGKKLTISGIVDDRQSLDRMQEVLQGSLPKDFSITNNIKIKKKESENKQKESQARLVSPSKSL